MQRPLPDFINKANPEPESGQNRRVGSLLQRSEPKAMLVSEPASDARAARSSFLGAGDQDLRSWARYCVGASFRVLL
jgi:hypothetical protein